MSMLTLTTQDSQLAQAPSDIRTGQYSAMTLDLQILSYVRPFCLVRYRSLIDLALDNGLKVQVLPPSDQNAKDYADRMGLFKGTSYTYPYKCNAATHQGNQRSASWLTIFNQGERNARFKFIKWWPEQSTSKANFL